MTCAWLPYLSIQPQEKVHERKGSMVLALRTASGAAGLWKRGRREWREAVEGGGEGPKLREASVSLPAAHFCNLGFQKPGHHWPLPTPSRRYNNMIHQGQSCLGTSYTISETPFKKKECKILNAGDGSPSCSCTQTGTDLLCASGSFYENHKCICLPFDATTTLLGIYLHMYIFT